MATTYAQPDDIDEINETTGTTEAHILKAEVIIDTNPIVASLGASDRLRAFDYDALSDSDQERLKYAVAEVVASLLEDVPDRDVSVKRIKADGFEKEWFVGGESRSLPESAMSYIRAMVAYRRAASGSVRPAGSRRVRPEVW